LRAQGRLQEAFPALRAALRLAEEEEDWADASICAGNLGGTELLVGQIAAALATAKKSVVLADRSRNAFRMMVTRSTEADALHTAGEREEATDLFGDAERRWREWQPKYPVLYSVPGYRYCNLLLSRGKADEARDRRRRLWSGREPNISFLRSLSTP
jgi:hypothetical protein